MQASNEILGPSGTSLAMRSTTPYGMPITRPASLIAALGCILPNVMIWATLRRPYFSAT